MSQELLHVAHKTRVASIAVCFVFLLTSADSGKCFQQCYAGFSTATFVSQDVVSSEADGFPRLAAVCTAGCDTCSY